MTAKRLLLLGADTVAYGISIFVIAFLIGSVSVVQFGRAGSYHVTMIKQILDMNGLTAGRDVLTPNGELWRVDEVVVSAQDIGAEKIVISPKISAHRIK